VPRVILAAGRADFSGAGLRLNIAEGLVVLRRTVHNERNAISVAAVIRRKGAVNGEETRKGEEVGCWWSAGA
jgi:hypothetical protein